MSRIWIKICGITRPQDAHAAVRSGADALGAVFYPPSKRAVALAELPVIMADVPATVRRVALFVNPGRSEVEAVSASGAIDWLQFHGEESADFCESFGFPYIKALTVKAGTDVGALAERYASAELLLLDTYDAKAPGGTGKSFDWSLVENLPEAIRSKLVLAGGLSPDNIATAVTQVNPFGVDVSTGVESAPGIKDADKIKAFIEGARGG